MSRRRRRDRLIRTPLLLALALLATGLAAADAPDEASGRGDRRKAQWGLPDSVRISFGDFVEQEREVRFFGYVVIEGGDARIQADEVIYRREPGVFEAVGAVVLSFPGAVLAGDRLVYNIASQTGVIEGVVGYLDQDHAIMRAQRVERLGPERLRVDHAVFTTCSQPTPYWSFRLRHGTFDLGRYAYLRGVSFRVRGAPLFYSPYLVWPIKSERATGLLFPEFSSSNRLGASVAVPFYWPVASNADLTLKVAGHSKVGVGLDAVLDWLPSWRGEARGQLFYINDRVRSRSRYRATWRQVQELRSDLLLTVNIEGVSDFDYFTDYETDLRRAAAPLTVSTVDLTRTWSWYSLSLRGRRYQQFFAGLNNETVSNALPLIEWRGRSQRLGRSPFHLSFESSLAAFSRRIKRDPAAGGGAGADGASVSASDRWTRADLAPQLQLPLTRAPWADLTFTLGWRGTWYSAGPGDPEAPETLVRESVWRTLWNAGFVFAGPRLQRVFPTPGWAYSTKLKHVVEPVVEYRWRPSANVTADDIPKFDEVDALPVELSDLTYGLRQRLFALRRPAAGRTAGLASAREATFDALEREAKQDAERAERDRVGSGVGAELEESVTPAPVEFASLAILQNYSFLRSLSRSYAYRVNETTDGLTVVETAARSYSPVSARLRFNPTSDQVIDVNYTFDVLNRTGVEAGVSALLRLSERTYFSGTWFQRRPVRPDVEGANFLRSRWGLASPNRRLSLETSWDWNVQTKKLDHQSYQARWATQCCSFRVGYDNRSFAGAARREVSLVVDLSGIGEVLNLQQSFSR